MARSVLIFLLPILLFLSRLGAATSYQLISPNFLASHSSGVANASSAESVSQTESREILGLEEREKALKCIGKGFPETKQSLNDTIVCLLSIMKEDREIKQQKRQGQVKPWKETRSISAARTVSVGVPTTRAYPAARTAYSSKEVVSPRAYYSKEVHVANASSAESVSQTESREILGLEEREKAFKCLGKGFPEIKKSLNDTIVCLFSILMKKDREINQQKRQGQVEPWTAYSSKEAASPRARKAFMKCVLRNFPDRNHTILCLLSRIEEEKEIKQQKRQGQAAPWTDWLRSLFLHH